MWGMKMILKELVHPCVETESGNGIMENEKGFELEAERKREARRKETLPVPVQLSAVLLGNSL
jgi:hypothetical protein